MDPGNIRNFKDFLQLYNQITEKCFMNCVDNFNSRSLEPDEISCVEKCQNKFIRFNHRLTSNFVKLQSIIMSRRMQEMEAQQQAAVEANQEQNLPHDPNIGKIQQNDPPNLSIISPS